MKHPSLRVADILHMDIPVRMELLNYLNGIRPLCPFPEKVVDVQLVGSYSRGNAKLGSDMDINISYKDPNDQKPAHIVFREKDNPYAPKMIDYLKQYELKYGIHIDCGVTDCETEKYNVFCSLNDMKAYHRLDEVQPEEWINGYATPPVDHPLGEGIDLTTYDVNKDAPVRQKDFHLRYDTMSWRWLVVPRIEKKYEWFEDEWADLVPEWQIKYGDKFLEYVQMTDPNRNPPTFLCPKP